MILLADSTEGYLYTPYFICRGQQIRAQRLSSAISYCLCKVLEQMAFTFLNDWEGEGQLRICNRDHICFAKPE